MTPDNDLRKRHVPDYSNDTQVITGKSYSFMADVFRVRTPAVSYFQKMGGLREIARLQRRIFLGFLTQVIGAKGNATISAMEIIRSMAFFLGILSANVA